MEQHIVADTVVFSNDLKSTGHTAVYGIYFDTGTPTTFVKTLIRLRS